MLEGGYFGFPAIIDRSPFPTMAEPTPEPVVPEVKKVAENEDGTYGKFQVGPLEPGFGLTLGNALRRVLLSSLPGTAVTSVKIDGVQHEFSTVPYMKEDVTEFLLNVKQLRLKAYADRSDRLQLNVSGEGRVTAADIEVPGDFEIANPELPLATLDAPEARLTVEFRVRRGKGYQPAGQQDGLSIGEIPVDAIFTPIRRVAFSVEPLRQGTQNYDQLMLEVWTDRTISPADSVSEAARILQDYLNPFVELGQIAAKVADKAAAGTAQVPQKIYDKPIEELDLSVRSYNCLKRSGITTVGQILEMSEDDLLAVRNFGRKSLDELHERLAALGLDSYMQRSTSPVSDLDDEDEDFDFEDSQEVYSFSPDDEDE